jgi:hypothetical protein
MNNTLLTTLALFLGIAGCAFGDNVTLALQPATGYLTGTAGSTVGWGFSLTNTTSDFLVVANSFFCEGAQNPVSSTCSPRLGVYSDIIAGNATVVDPGSTVTQRFNADGSSGLGNFAVWSSAATGQTDTGLIFVVYDLFNANPFSQPADQIGGDQTVSAPAAVSIGTSAAVVPEPALPLASGFFILCLLAIRHRWVSKLQLHD